MPTYTAHKLTSAIPTLSNGGSSLSAPTDNFNNQYITHYYGIRFAASGIATIKLVGIYDSRYNEGHIQVYASTTEQFNQSTGWPTSNVGSTGLIYVSSTAQIVLRIAVDAYSTSNKTYYFWWHNPDSTASVTYAQATVEVSFQESSVIWRDSLVSLGSLGAVTQRTVSNPAQYRLYRFAASFTTTGTCRFKQISVGNTYMYITDSYNAYMYDWTTGLLDTSNPAVKDWTSSGQKDFSLDVNISTANKTYYFWIRYLNGTLTDPITIEITPPGTIWEAVDYLNIGLPPLSITQAGLQRGVGILGDHEIWYIPITFASNGNFEFYLTSSENFYGYISDSLVIDGNGDPQHILAQDKYSSGGFSFLWSGMTAGTTYYLMFRTATGSPNSSNATINIEYKGGASVWRMPSENIDDLTTPPMSSQYVSYHRFNNGTQYNMYKKVVKFAASGIASFYSEAGSGTVGYPIGWITEHETTFDSVNGQPPSGATILAQDTNTGGNRQFTMETDQIVAGVTYDFWFRLYDGTLQNRYSRIYIVPPPPWTEDDRTSDTSMTGLSGNVTNKSCQLSSAQTAKYAISFTQNGTATISSDGSIAVSGYLGTLDNSIYTANGVPQDYAHSDVGNNDFSITWNVVAGTTYYFWIKGNNSTVTGTTYLNIQFTAAPTPTATRGFWLYVKTGSNPDTFQWKRASLYIGSSNRTWPASSAEATPYVALVNGWPSEV